MLIFPLRWSSWLIIRYLYANSDTQQRTLAKMFVCILAILNSHSVIIPYIKWMEMGESGSRQYLTYRCLSVCPCWQLKMTFIFSIAGAPIASWVILPIWYLIYKLSHFDSQVSSTSSYRLHDMIPKVRRSVSVYRYEMRAEVPGEDDPFIISAELTQRELMSSGVVWLYITWSLIYAVPITDSISLPDSTW